MSLHSSPFHLLILPVFLCSAGSCPVGRRSNFSPSRSTPLFPSYYLLFLLHSCLFLALAFSGFLTPSLSGDLSRSPTCWAACSLVCTSFAAHPHFLPVTPFLQLLVLSSPSASSPLTFFFFLNPFLCLNDWHSNIFHLLHLISSLFLWLHFLLISHSFFTHFLPDIQCSASCSS